MPVANNRLYCHVVCVSIHASCLTRDLQGFFTSARACVVGKGDARTL